MTTQPTAPTTTAPATASLSPPILQPGIKALGTARDMSIVMDFNTAMAAGNGTIIVTDGAVQTVIDRATGLPTMRVVGATDTHTIAASSLVIDGAEVTLHVTNLLPGHKYSVVMGADALQSSDHVAFGGVRSTSLLSFPTPAAGPTLVAAGSDGGILKADGSIAVTLKFSEAVTNLPLGALDAPHAAVTGATTADGGITWVVHLGAPAGATTAAGNVLTLDMSQLVGTSGYHGSGTGALATYAVDTQAPTASVALDGTLLASGHDAVATIHFSEAVTGLTPAALSAGHATVSNLHTTDGGTTWLATLSGNAATTAGDNVLAVDLAQVRDLAGNAGSGTAASGSYTVDTQGPTAKLELSGGVLHTGGTIGLTLHFSEAVTDLTPAALRAPGATLGNLQHSSDYLTWTATLTPQAGVTDTTNAVSLDLAQIHDAAGNAGSGSTFSGNYTVDTQAPDTVAIALDGAVLGGARSIHATFTFAESLQDLPLAAISAPHANVADLRSNDGGKTWTATLTPNGSGTWADNAVSVDLTKVVDLAGNSGNGTGTGTAYTVDTQGPAATLTLAGSDLTIRFNEAVTDLTAAALQAPDATLGNLQHSSDWLTWTATVTPQGDNGGNTASLDLAQVHDALGNTGSGIITTSAVDVTPPTVMDILFDDTTIGQAHGIGFTITFSESVSGLTAAALQAPHADVSGLATLDGGRTWTGMLTAAAGATSSIDNALAVDLTQVRDAAGNAGTGTATSVSHYGLNMEPVGATVDLDGAALVNGASVAVTIHFSAPVAALDAAAISAPHATLADLHHSADNLTWYATLSAADAGVVDGTNVVSVDLAQVHDTLGNAGSGTASSGNYTFDTAVAGYVSGIHVNDAGPFADDGVTNAGNEYVEGYFVGSLTDTQHLRVTYDGQEVDPYGLHVGTPSGGVTAWYYASEAYMPAGVHTYTASIVDANGHASVTVSKQITVDMTNPRLTGSPDGNAAFDVAGNLVLTFDKAVYWTNGEGAYDGLQLYDHDGASTYLDLADGDFSSDHKTITLTADELHLGSGNDYTLYLPYSLTDLAGNQVAYESIVFHTAGTYVDVTPPSATGLAAGSGGVYGIGSTIDISVTFSEPVNVAGDGTPVLLLDNGATATFVNTSADRRSAVFEYKVAAGDQDVAGLDIANRADLAGHFADDAGHLLDQAHITFGYLLDGDGYGHSIQIDAHAPDAPPAPHLAAGSDTGTVGDDVTSIMAPTITGSGAEAWARIDLYAGDHLAGSGQADGSGNWAIDSVVLGTDGIYSLTAIQYDDANNASAPSQPLAVTVAGAAIAMTRLDADVDNGLSATDNITSLTRPAFTGTVAAGTTVTVWDGSTVLGSTTAGGDGAWHFAPGWDLANGQHTITLELADANNNVTPRELSAPYTFTIDAVAPYAPGTPLLAAGSDTGVSASDGITMDTTPTLAGTAFEAGGKVEVYDGDTLLGNADVGTDGAWSFTPGAGQALADGVHTLTARQVDAAGNRSAASAPLSITVDTTAPTITVSQSYTKSSANWHSLEFSEHVVFVKNSAIDVLDGLNVGKSHHAWDLTNWDITTNAQGVQNTLELNLGTLNGSFHLAVADNAIQDVAGNVAIIGTSSFSVGLA
jgi:hypothetical protein